MGSVDTGADQEHTGGVSKGAGEGQDGEQAESNEEDSIERNQSLGQVDVKLQLQKKRGWHQWP